MRLDFQSAKKIAKILFIAWSLYLTQLTVRLVFVQWHKSGPPATHRNAAAFKAYDESMLWVFIGLFIFSCLNWIAIIFLPKLAKKTAAVTWIVLLLPNLIVLAALAHQALHGGGGDARIF